MPKNLDQTTVKECHDCGQTGKNDEKKEEKNEESRSGPEWCSINHGVLLCDECASVHLGLGRHISQIKSLKRSFWPPSQLNVRRTTRKIFDIEIFPFVSVFFAAVDSRIKCKWC